MQTVTVSISEPEPQPPAAPTILVASVEMTGKGKNRVVSHITLSWTDNSDNETGFIVESCKEEVTCKGKNRSVTCEYVEAGSANPDSTAFSPDLSNGHDHFRVKAVNDTGSSDYSNEVRI